VTGPIPKDYRQDVFTVGQSAEQFERTLFMSRLSRGWRCHRVFFSGITILIRLNNPVSPSLSLSKTPVFLPFLIGFSAESMTKM